MISFKELPRGDGLSALSTAIPEELIEEVLIPIAEDSADGEAAYTVSHGCLLVKVLINGEYAFLFPFEIDSSARLTSAIKDLAAYATYQEIPLTVIDIPAELRYAIEECGFSHVEYEYADEDGESLIADVMTECRMLESIPTVKGERLTLSPLTYGDSLKYAELCKDSELNKYWGYDYKDDMADASDTRFIEETEREFFRGTAITFAVRDGEGLVGDVVIYGFDFFGNAAAGVRIAREYQGRGYGRECSDLLFSVAKEIGLSSIRASIMKANIPSCCLYSKLMSKVSEDEDRYYFERRL